MKHGINLQRDNMTLDFPYPVFVWLYDNRLDANLQSDIWVYAKDMSSYVATSSGQTSDGITAIDIQNVANANGDIIKVYVPGYCMEEFILDISTPVRNINLYYNYNSTQEVSIDGSEDGSTYKYLTPEKLFSDTMYLRTYYG